MDEASRRLAGTAALLRSPTETLDEFRYIKSGRVLTYGCEQFRGEPSETGASSFTCSGRLIPKPIQIGRSVRSRSQATSSDNLTGNSDRSPVIPVTDT